MAGDLGDFEQHASLSRHGDQAPAKLDLLSLLSTETAIPATSESMLAKVDRSANLLLGGITSGAIHRASELLNDSPGKLGIEIAVPAALGYGLMAMQEAGGKLGSAAKAIGFVLGAGMLVDGANRGAQVSAAISDNWSSPQNYQRNKESVGRTLGAAVTDYSLMSLSGFAGARAFRFQSNPTHEIGDWGWKYGQSKPGGMVSAAAEPGNAEAISFASTNKIVADFYDKMGVPKISSVEIGANTNAYWADNAMHYGSKFVPPPPSIGELALARYNFENTYFQKTESTPLTILPTSFLDKNQRK